MFFRSLVPSLHWWICLGIAGVATGSTILLNLPMCLGCLCVQGLFWIRVVTKSRAIVITTMFLSAFVLAILSYQALHPSLTCPFDVLNPLPSCSQVSQTLIGGWPFAVWGMIGATILGIWALLEKN